MRPKIERAESLRRQIAEARAELAGVDGKINGLTAGPAAQLRALNERDEENERENKSLIGAAADIEQEIRVHEAELTKLHDQLGAVAKKLYATMMKREAHAKERPEIEQQVAIATATLAPRKERVEHEIAKLERRLTTVEAYHPEQRLRVLFPGGADDAATAAGPHAMTWAE
jgi:chromosome segregation ATPase